MYNKQQEEALQFFNKDAKNWISKKEADIFDDRANTIRQRNNYVLHVIDQREKTFSALDVGCGAGELVWDMAERGIDATGVDFATEMIEIAQAQNNSKSAIKPKFVCDSIFNFEMGRETYDVISANGFIEYISLEQINLFFRIVHCALRQGGSFVFGSRNRLFNLYSLNKFTEYEQEKGKVELMLKESIALANRCSVEDLARFDTVALPEADQEQAKTGVDVFIRYQFTPAQIVNMLKSSGFETKAFSPVHIHGILPIFMKEHPDVHGGITTLLDTYACEDFSFIPHASSFMVHAVKR